LLFSDTVSLIVPKIDQRGVQRRRHVEEILQIDDSLIKFKDPTHRYSAWMNRDGVAQATESLIEKLFEQIEQDGDLALIHVDKRGHVNPGQDDEIFSRWSKKIGNISLRKNSHQISGKCSSEME
jgi:hypothetical protein